MSEFGGIWKHENNQHALVTRRRNVAALVAEELKTVICATPPMEERRREIYQGAPLTSICNLGTCQSNYIHFRRRVSATWITVNRTWNHTIFTTGENPRPGWWLCHKIGICVSMRPRNKPKIINPRKTNTGFFFFFFTVLKSVVADALIDDDTKRRPSMHFADRRMRVLLYSKFK